ncbi:MAG: ABC transporter permease [Betaproteobacteria bacterium]|nr:ABC transporter permease [Betaproteobacteria bacterium]
MKARWDLVLIPPLVVSLALLVISQSVFLYGSFRRDLGIGKQGDALELYNYFQAFADPYYLDTLRLSLEASVAATILTITIAFPVAYVIARMRSRWAMFLLAAVVVSSFVTIVIKVLGLILIFSSNGPFNQLLLALGLIDEPFTIIGSLSGVVVGLMYYSFGYAVLLFYSVVMTVPRSVEEAAEVLGATRWQVFRQVVLPLCLPGLVAGVLTVFNLSMGGFSSTALIGAGKVLTVPVVIQRTMLLETNFGMAATLSALLLLSVIVINVLSVAAVARVRKEMVL